MSISSSPAPGTSYGLRFLIPSSILLALALLTSITRLYTRCRPKCLLRWDDYTLVFALLLLIVWYAIVTTLYSYGRGVVGYAQPASIVGPLGATCGVLWFWSMNMLSTVLTLRDSRESYKQNNTIQKLTYITIGCLPIGLTAAIFAVPEDQYVIPQPMGLGRFIGLCLILFVAIFIISIFLDSIISPLREFRRKWKRRVVDKTYMDYVD
ncbi:hypothetical protein QWA68_015135 [Fusarium oxysporum]|nr:hypothetical protein QWA68_015135 [Fusarium oxysporum]